MAYNLLEHIPKQSPRTRNLAHSAIGTCIDHLKSANRDANSSDKLFLSAGDGCFYGFQGQEGDDDWSGLGNSVNYKYRMHDPRIGRIFAVDPLFRGYPCNSPFSENKVFRFVEFEGIESFDKILNDTIEAYKSAIKLYNTAKIIARYSSRNVDAYEEISTYKISIKVTVGGRTGVEFKNGIGIGVDLSSVVLLVFSIVHDAVTSEVDTKVNYWGMDRKILHSMKLSGLLQVGVAVGTHPSLSGSISKTDVNDKTVNKILKSEQAISGGLGAFLIGQTLTSSKIEEKDGSINSSEVISASIGAIDTLGLGFVTEIDLKIDVKAEKVENED